MSNRNSAFFLFSKSVAENFLQTAVIVDDQAYFNEPASSDKQAEKTPSIPAGRTDFTLETPSEDQSLAGPSHLLDAKTVINSFAQKGIVCSVLKPDEGDKAALLETAKKLAMSADVIILDWDIHKDKGEAVLQLVNDIVVNNGETPHQLHLIVIYTGEPDIGGVAQKIKKQLVEVSNLAVDEDRDNLSMSTHSVRIVIFAKPDTEVVPQFSYRKISFARLVDTVTEEFTEMASGLVSNVVLESLAQVRKNTYKILSRFSADLDAPYLTHRTLHADPEDAEDQLITLVAGELQAILEECQVAKKANLERVKEWIADKRPLDDKRTYISSALSDKLRGIIENRQLEPKRKISAFQEVCANDNENPFIEELNGLLNETARPQAIVNTVTKWFEENRVPSFILLDGDNNRDLTRESVIDLLEKGVEHSSVFSPRQREKSHKSSFTSMFLNDQGKHQLDEKFAVVTTLRSFYDHGEHRLTLGTVVEHAGSFWVCIQPKCDTYRISDVRAFPFLPLTSSDPDKNFDLVVKQDQYLRLSISQKPYSLKLWSFEPNNKQVIGTKNQVFTDVDGNAFKWIGELRAEQAQRLSNRFSTELSRVGVNESQWLRRWSSKD